MAELLTQHPDAVVLAIGNDGISVPWPTSLPLSRQRIAVARSLLDMVVPGDRMTVINAWERARTSGGATCVIHLSTNPEQDIAAHIVDARADHGIYVAMMIPASGRPGGLDAVGSSLLAPPRTARLRKNEMAVVLDLDEALTRILGWTNDEMVGRRTLDFIHPDDHERAIGNWMEMLTAPGHEQRVRLRHRASDGSWIWMEVTNRNLLQHPDHECVLTEMLDISDELAAQEALREREQLLHRLAEALPLGVLVVGRDRSIRYVNERLSAITGEVGAPSVYVHFRHVVEGDRLRMHEAIDAVLDHGTDQDIEVEVEPLPTGDTRNCFVSLRSLTNESGAVTGAVICVSDVTEQARMTAELEHRATYDALTACHNRRSVMTILEQHLADPGPGLGIVFIDLDGFKGINDTLGHVVGDSVLAQVGAALLEAVRPGDIVGRTGGDEFLIVCPGMGMVADANAFAAKIRAALVDAVRIDGRTTAIGASFGVAHTNSPRATTDTLVAEADAAMYAAKRRRSLDAASTAS